MTKKTIHSDEYRQLIEKLLCERKRLGLSQLDVAEEVGMTQSELSKTENLERRLDALELKKLLIAYRIDSNRSLELFIMKFFNLEK